MKKYFVFFVISIILFFAHAIYTKHAIYGDGNGYYSYTQSLYFEKSLNFTPIYNHLQNFQGRNYIFSRIFWDTKNNPYPVGTGIIWMPSMAFMSLFSANRFDLTYELGPGITGIILTVAGLFFLEKYLLKRFNKNAVFFTILILFFGTNIFYYTAFEPALSHQPAFFLICLMLYLTSKKSTNIFTIGILSGLFSMIRMPDTILLIPIFFELKKKIREWPYFIAGYLIAFSPQIANQIIQYGGVFANPYLNGQSGTWQFNIYHSLEFLVSVKRGLFVWTPALVIGLIGLIKQKSKIIIFTLALMWIVTSSWSAYLSAGFGQRFMYSSIPYFSIGVAYIFNNRKRLEIILYSIPFVIWNFTLLIGFYIFKLGS